ncbi:hypothetical protein FPV67DRAFT_1678045 [Lyophyllum atratum]|nr:hypothetical protein FPV67DRAFT_1678045 [Lyophyllum atratum]
MRNSAAVIHQHGDEAGGDEPGWLATTRSDCSIRAWELSEPTAEEEPVKSITPPKHQLIASINSAHRAYDVNAIAWCPRPGFPHLLATAGDDGATKVWRVVPA